MFPSYKDKVKDLKNDLNAVKVLRNEIYHNRFILNNKKLGICSVGDKSASLWANVMNLKGLLPDFAQENFCKEINDCKKEANPIYPNQTDWNLIDELIIAIS